MSFAETETEFGSWSMQIHMHDVCSQGDLCYNASKQRAI